MSPGKVDHVLIGCSILVEALSAGADGSGFDPLGNPVACMLSLLVDGRGHRFEVRRVDASSALTVVEVVELAILFGATHEQTPCHSMGKPVGLLGIFPGFLVTSLSACSRDGELGVSIGCVVLAVISFLLDPSRVVSIDPAFVFDLDAHGKLG